jgi:hypothetical protein
MEDNISFVETEQIDTKIQIILRQTDYNIEQARTKLADYNYDETSVIKAYLGIDNKKSSEKIKSINQEIYKQLRYKLDSNMRDYLQRVDKGEVKKVV